MYDPGMGPASEQRAIARPGVSWDNIGNAWQAFRENMGTWVAAQLIAGLCLSVAMTPYLIYTFSKAFANASTGGGAGQNSDLSAALAASAGDQVISTLVSIVFGAISYIFQGGMILMAIRQLRGESISVGDVFSGFRFAGPLFLGGLLVSLGTTFGTYLCLLPGLIFQGLWMLTMPLIVDQKLDAISAMRESWNQLRSDLWNATGFHIVLGIVASIGVLACGFGALFTMPLLPLGIALVYRDNFPDNEV